MRNLPGAGRRYAIFVDRIEFAIDSAVHGILKDTGKSRIVRAVDCNVVMYGKISFKMEDIDDNQ